MKRAWILVLPVAIVVGFSCSSAEPRNTAAVNSVNTSGPAHTPLPAATIDEIANGQKLYADNCTVCHKENGTGGEVVIEGTKIKPDDLTSAKIKGFSDEKILGYVMNGVPDEGMPAFKDKLSEGEMRAVVRYVRTELQKMPTKAAEAPKADQLAN